MSRSELKDLAVIHATRAWDLSQVIVEAIAREQYEAAAQALPDCNHAVQMAAGFVGALLNKPLAIQTPPEDIAK